MYKVKLFSALKSDALEQQVNEWLQVNREILIHSSNMADNGENTGTSQYVFYILYTGADALEEELKEMAATVTQEQSIESKEINPEILTPSS